MVVNNSGTVIGASPEESWDIQINNPSTQTAPYTWGAFQKGSSGIIVDSLFLEPANTLIPAISFTDADGHDVPCLESLEI